MNLNPNILTFEPYLRVIIFFGVFIVMGGLELMIPRRPLIRSKKQRWFSNISIVLINTMVARTVLPMAPVAFAVFCQQQNWGVFNFVNFASWIEIGLAIILLDFAIWLQHVVVHFVPVFWRLHRLHHADADIDVTTGARFHPLEILLSLGIKFFLIILTGASPIAVMLFEIILNAMAMFNHANVRLPLKLDGALRWIVVTPDFHRVHHSVLPHETNANYGFNLSLWDRIFKTYIAQPEKGHDLMTIGLDIFRAPVEQRLDHMLTQPFRNDPAKKNKGELL